MSIACDNTSPILVLDDELASISLKEYREVIFSTKEKEVILSGSKQFSAQAIKAKFHNSASKNFWVVDLRRESHGYVNGLPVSWYLPGNTLNSKDDSDTIESKEKSLLRSLTKKATALIHEIIEKAKGCILNTKEHTIDVKTIQSEQSLITDMGFNYQRFYVQDHNAPSDATIDSYLQFYRTLPKSHHLHFHCRGGKGRTTTFMVMYDILKNSKQDSFTEILNRQAKINPMDLRIISDDPAKRWKQEAAIDRLETLKLFYKYTKDSEGINKRSYSEWRLRI